MDADQTVDEPTSLDATVKSELVPETPVDGESEVGEEAAVDSDFEPSFVLELAARLESLGWNPKASNSSLGWRMSFRLPAGRSSRSIVVDEQGAEALLGVDLGDWRSLERYEGIWSAQKGQIEVALRGNGSGTPARWALSRLLRVQSRHSGVEVSELVAEDEDSGVVVRIGEGSTIANLLSDSRFSSGRTPQLTTLKITNLELRTTEEADSVLESVMDAISFDLSQNFGVSMSARRLRSRQVRTSRWPRTVGQFSFPRNLYPHAAMTMYQGGIEAVNSPLIRYWSFYQVLEYFFPRFSREYSVNQLARFLKSPAFSPHRSEDVIKAVEIANSASTGAISEVEQLKVTIRSVVSEIEVRQFIQASGLEDQLQKKKSELSGNLVRLNSGTDLLDQLSERIYDIRCRIVHSKSMNSRDGGPGLLPGTHHDDLVLGEVELIKFLAEQALLSASGRLSVRGIPDDRTE